MDPSQRRGIEYRRQLIERAGGTLSVDQVAELIKVTPEAVRNRIRTRSYIAVPDAKDYGLPAIQFEDGHEIRGLRTVLRAIPMESPYMRLDWLLSPEPRLQGRRPIDVLRGGENIEEVKSAASLVGEHGAA